MLLRVFQNIARHENIFLNGLLSLIWLFGSNKELNKEKVYDKIMCEYFMLLFHSLFMFAVQQVIFLSYIIYILKN